jgi:hypothetical protein
MRNAHKMKPETHLVYEKGYAECMSCRGPAFAFQFRKTAGNSRMYHNHATGEASGALHVSRSFMVFFMFVNEI